jgi:DNA/RNA endonuclease YhcR with UshA esterase domain
MKIPQTIMSVAFVILVVLLFTSPRHRVPMYEASDEVTIQGTVQDVQEFYCPISGRVGTHLTVKTENGNIQVHVAPAAFLSDHNLSFRRGDSVQVVGSRVIFQGHGAVIARAATLRGQTIAFREANGHPLWTN